MRPVGMPQPFHLPQHSYVHVLVSSITDGCALEGSSHGVSLESLAEAVCVVSCLQQAAPEEKLKEHFHTVQLSI